MSAEPNLKSLLLDYYHCTFFLPLAGLKEDIFQPAFESYQYGSGPEPELGEKEAQAYRYFSPVLRDILFDTGQENSSPLSLVPLKEWRVPEDTLQDWTLHLGWNKDKGKSDRYQIAKIQAVSLYRYFNGIFLLAFRVEPLALCQLRDEVDDPLFSNEGCKSIFDLSLLHPARKVAYEQLQLEHWLRFTKLPRTT